MINLHRRDFIRASLFGGLAAVTKPAFATDTWAEQTKVAVGTDSRVSLVTGTNRAEMAFNALLPFSTEIAKAVGNKRIVVKPNMVEADIPLCATHKDTIEGVLEFYKSIDKLKNVVIGESIAFGPAMSAYECYGYIPVAEKYKVKLLDLDEHPYQINSTTATSGKRILHGNGYRAINYNMFSLAFHVRPDLAFVDGYEGMEGTGPTRGTPVDHKVCIAGLDWMSVERVGLKLMGIDPANIGYLTFCADAGMGQFDLDKIEVIGEKLSNHIKTYQLPDSFEQTLQWKTPFKEK